MKIKGFSLIELMIVITIIGILAAVAVPAYQDYVIRAKVSGAISILASFRNALAEAYNVNGQFSTTNIQTSLGTINDGGDLTVTVDNVARIYYNAQTKSAHLAVELVKGIIPGADAAASGASSGRWIFIGAVPDANGNLSFSCGHWGNGDWSFSAANLKYYPASCNSDVYVLSKWATNGA